MTYREPGRAVIAARACGWEKAVIVTRISNVIVIRKETRAIGEYPEWEK
jgi:hypothetical protein